MASLFSAGFDRTRPAKTYRALQLRTEMGLQNICEVRPAVAASLPGLVHSKPGI